MCFVRPFVCYLVGLADGFCHAMLMFARDDNGSLTLFLSWSRREQTAVPALSWIPICALYTFFATLAQPLCSCLGLFYGRPRFYTGALGKLELSLKFTPKLYGTTTKFTAV